MGLFRLGYSMGRGNQARLPDLVVAGEEDDENSTFTFIFINSFITTLLFLMEN